ncbi:MAG: aggregation factor core [Hyphomicrobiales bacterium]
MTLIRHVVAGAAFSMVLGALPALANVEVTFREGAPKDRFVIANTGNCATGPVDITIDLSGSDAGLIFDVTNSGQGVEVFQPFVLVSGKSFVSDAPVVKDGDNKVTLSLSDLVEGKPIAFTVDVDDTAGGREITVSGSEIAGASISVSGGASGVFGTNAIAQAKAPGCKS